MNFTKYLNSILNKYGYTRHSFSDKLNVSYNTFCSWTYGSRIPNAYQIIELVNVISDLTNTTPNHQQRKIMKCFRDDKLDKGL